MSEGWFGTHALPGERTLRQLSEKITFDVLSMNLRNKYPPDVLYGAMLVQVQKEGRKPGLAHYCFTDLFGQSARHGKEVELVYLDDSDFEEWMRIRALQSKRKWLREKARKRAK
jgi:hypothetical protein